MLTFYSEDVQHARIVYYANEKKSAIAPKITDQGADSVSYQVNEVFAQTLSEVALGIAESMSAYADEADVGGRIAGVSGKVRDMGAQAERMASVLELYSSLAGAAQTLASDSGKLVVAAHCVSVWTVRPPAAWQRRRQSAACGIWQNRTGISPGGFCKKHRSRGFRKEKL